MRHSDPSVMSDEEIIDLLYQREEDVDEPDWDIAAELEQERRYYADDL